MRPFGLNPRPFRYFIAHSLFADASLSISGYHGRRFLAQHITFGGLDSFPYIEDLNGHKLKLKLDYKLFPDAQEGKYRKPKVSVDLSVRGKNFKGNVEGKEVVFSINYNITNKTIN